MRFNLSLSLASLKRQEGSQITWEDTIEAPETMGHEFLHVPALSPLDISLSLSSVSEGVYVQGSIYGQVHGECSRCLRPIDEKRVFDIGELVFYPERREALIHDGDEDAVDAPVIDNDTIDLEPIVRDTIVLALPFQALCREDCSGLCPQCGQVWEELPDNHSHDAPYDSRFDALAELEAQLREGQ